MNKTAVLAGIALLCELSLGCATHLNSSSGTGDARITSAIEAGIRQHPDLEAPNWVRVQTVKSTVYLYGHVDTEVEHQAVLAAAKQAAGGDRIVDSMHMTDIGG